MRWPRPFRQRPRQAGSQAGSSASGARECAGITICPDGIQRCVASLRIRISIHPRIIDMATIGTERVLTVHHWNSTLFSFTTTRDPGFRFENGHFVMMGLPIEGKPLLRAYSIASANHDDYLEFFSIKVEQGALTSKLQHLKIGDEVLVSRKPTGTLTIHDLLPGKHLYLLATGTGLAPFLSLIKD